ncbi:MAG TPA: FHA domain-containing protein [Thermoleophilaceae bacterium]|jgi:DNA-directed RNA polymerase subunit RPC12/RpoP
MEAFSAGTLAGAGSFQCDSCGFGIALHELDEVPACPECGGRRFKRASLFDRPDQAERHVTEGAPDWLAEAREALVEGGDYLAFDDGDRVHVVPIQDGWTRIGRSLSAHLRFDDPTVSRRHALVYRDDSGARILDDRSLNGVYHNGKRIELGQLDDGDELAIGRFRIFFLSLDQPGSREREPVESAVG